MQFAAKYFSSNPVASSTHALFAVTRSLLQMRNILLCCFQVLASSGCEFLVTLFNGLYLCNLTRMYSKSVLQIFASLQQENCHQSGRKLHMMMIYARAFRAPFSPDLWRDVYINVGHLRI